MFWYKLDKLAISSFIEVISDIFPLLIKDRNSRKLNGNVDGLTKVKNRRINHMANLQSNKNLSIIVRADFLTLF